MCYIQDRRIMAGRLSGLIIILAMLSMAKRKSKILYGTVKNIFFLKHNNIQIYIYKYEYIKSLAKKLIAAAAVKI